MTTQEKIPTHMTNAYQPYPAYKDSGVEWLGEIPEGWGLTRLKFESLIKARVGWHGLKSDEFTDVGPYLVTGSDFKGPEIQWENCYHCENDRYEQDPYIQLQNGDLLITKDGTIGKVALVQNLYGKATLNSGIFVVRPLSNRYTSKFYFWLLQSTVFHGFVDFYKTGSTIAHLYQNVFENLAFALPSLTEQTQIASFLDHETARIDTLIAKQETLIALLKEKRQAVISHAVTKGLNPDVEMKDSGVEWLGEVPAHWDVVQIRRVLIKMEQGKSPECMNEPAADNQWGVLKTSCVNNAVFDLNQNKALPPHIKPFPEYEVKTGDLLMSRASGSVNLIGSVALVENTPSKILLSDKIFRLYLSNIIENRYFSLLMTSFYMRECIKQSISGAEGMANNITKSSIMAFKIPLPPKSEQLTINNYLVSKISKIDNLITRGQQQKLLLKERRTALISAAVTGKIDLRDWQAPQGET